ncbi:Arginase/agmatinase/formiminoglutamase [Halothece sp. PCC 7418]|uniref:agmatinase family protein n=1 Tax=Halothece sp. (strain PCC 7418) TaxID=65093 RepID=UPI0002A05CFD|nr:agmatinase family protein [Halothece sp. PCC 7418]AFZ42958.1 Arginase/agmatinase/formiminoglutamase [Halothece sp. PCC 7418]
MKQFYLDSLDPDDISRPNGQFLGFPTLLEEAKMVFFPVPWDVTTSYGEGTARGSQAIIDASVQLEPTDYHVFEAWKMGHYTLPVNADILAKNDKIRIIAKRIIDYQEAGGHHQDQQIEKDLNEVNHSSEQLNQWVYEETISLLKQNQLIGLIGGDHSVPLGLMKALTEKYSHYGILQIDAHADLRNAYEGFTYSHASIMHNALQFSAISHLIQVGIRDFSEGEKKQAKADQRVQWFTDWELKEKAYQGYVWADQCQEIINCLPKQVYISFDVDGLRPEFCPHTGTPVPGGLDFNQAIYLIERVVKAGKTIIGFDLCEVSPDLNNPDDEWDANVGARLAYKLANFMLASQSATSF